MRSSRMVSSLCKFSLPHPTFLPKKRSPLIFPRRTITSSPHLHEKHHPIQSKEAELLTECGVVLNRSPEYVNYFFSQLDSISRSAISSKIVSDYVTDTVRHEQIPPQVVLREFSRVLGKDYPEEFRKADENNDGILSEQEVLKWIRSLEQEKPETAIPRPKFRQLYAVFVNQMVPFIGFGFMDNAIMIVAGDQIDYTLGVGIGLSTMAAAGLGNLLSDVCGVGFGGAIEAASQKLGLPSPNLTPSQFRMTRVRMTTAGGQMFGIALGCFLGMLPLLWLDQKKRRLQAIFAAFDVDGDGFIELDEIKECIDTSGLVIEQEVIEALVDALDTSKDGKLEFAEFEEFMNRFERIVTADSIKKSSPTNSAFVKWIREQTED